MILRTLLSRNPKKLTKLTPLICYSQNAPIISPFPQPLPTPPFTTTRHLHSSRVSSRLGSRLGYPLVPFKFDSDAEADDADGTTNESRFVWIMRKKIAESYPDAGKSTVDAMLLVIVKRVVSELEKGGFRGELWAAALSGGDFSKDLWKRVWEVSNTLIEAMNKERKKEKMKGFLQCEKVKQMCRFAGEVGIRGNMLREMRFKWAREKMEEHEFYEGLEHIRKEAEAEENEEKQKQEGMELGDVAEEEGNKVVGLLKRKGKIRYKIYGLDLSIPKWENVADRIHEAGQIMWPKEAKPITGKCKIVTERIVGLKVEEEGGDDELLRLLAEWVELLQPSRIDWMSLLDILKQQNPPLYFKVAEIVLTEDSFETNISDYSRLIHIYAKENRFGDAVRVLQKKMRGILLDAAAASTLVQVYSKVGNLKGAKEAYNVLRSLGFQPDIKVYNAMIMSYVKAGDPKSGEGLMREMETMDIKPTKEIYMALLQSFSRRGDVTGAGRISTTMQFAGFQQTLETCTLLVEAHAIAGDPEQARNNFDYTKKFGHKPDDRCTASMIMAYEKKNLLDKAVNLLLELEKDGFEPGVPTYSVLVDWFSKLQLINMAEHLLVKISLLGEAPPFKVQVSLCDMYARAGIEKKALQTLGILEARKNEMGAADFERIISGLITGGFGNDAQRMCGVMEAQGFTPSDSLKMALVAPRRKSPSRR